MTKNNTIINHDLISWARNRLGMSKVDFASRMNVSSEIVDNWEFGKLPITMSQAKKLASLSLLPLGMFFLDSIPDTDLHLPDFRSVNSANITDASPELQATIVAMQSKQNWYRSYMQDHKLPALSFIRTLTKKNTIVQAAGHIRSILKITENSVEHISKWEEYYNFLIQKIEEAGIIVIRNGVVGNNTHRRLDIDEFRGFVLLDDYAPLIFINGNDSKNAQIFTLVHELVHVFLGNSGITAAEMFSGGANPVEQYCNKVAAEFLVPEALLNAEWKAVAGNDVSETIFRFSKEFKVSKLVIIKRCRDLQLIPNAQAKELWQKELNEIRAYKERQKTAGGGNFFASLKYKVGEVFAQAVIAETAARNIPYTEAFYLLNVKNIDALRKLSERVGLPIL